MHIYDGMTTELDNGNQIEFWQDSGTESPLSYDDAVMIAALHNRLVNPNPEIGLDPGAVESWCKANARDYVTFPLFLYQHGASVYRASNGENPFSCPWDSGRVGIIALKKSEFSGDYLEIANSILAVYSDWSNGNCYGFTVKDSDGEPLDSCGGFIGSNPSQNGMSDHIDGILID